MKLLLFSLLCTGLCHAQTTPVPASPDKSKADAALLLPGTDAKDHQPLAAGDKKGVVLFFVSPYCPTSNTFMPEMNSIAADFDGAFQFYFVHADADQKPADILQHTELMKVKATVLMDKEQRLLQHTGAKTTPEAVVIGPDGKALYQGRINDLYLGPTKRQRQATTKDLRDALEAIKSGKAVAGEMVAAAGCKIKVLESKEAEGAKPEAPAKPAAEQEKAKG